MDAIQMAALGLLAAFYASYFVKMLLQRRKGVRTDQIGKGEKPSNVLRIEKTMKAATYTVVVVEAVSIVTCTDASTPCAGAAYALRVSVWRYL